MRGRRICRRASDRARSSGPARKDTAEGGCATGKFLCCHAGLRFGEMSWLIHDTATLEQDKLQSLGVGGAAAGDAGVAGGRDCAGVGDVEGAFGKTRNWARHFFHSYLAAFSFFTALTLCGALIFVLIQHASRAGWSVTVRRVAEGLSLNMFLMVLLLLPLVHQLSGDAGHFIGFCPGC